MSHTLIWQSFLAILALNIFLVAFSQAQGQVLAKRVKLPQKPSIQLILFAFTLNSFLAMIFFQAKVRVNREIISLTNATLWHELLAALLGTVAMLLLSQKRIATYSQNRKITPDHISQEININTFLNGSVFLIFLILGAEKFDLGPLNIILAICIFVATIALATACLYFVPEQIKFLKTWGTKLDFKRPIFAFIYTNAVKPGMIAAALLVLSMFFMFASFIGKGSASFSTFFGGLIVTALFVGIGPLAFMTIAYPISFLLAMFIHGVGRLSDFLAKWLSNALAKVLAAIFYSPIICATLHCYRLSKPLRSGYENGKRICEHCNRPLRASSRYLWVFFGENPPNKKNCKFLFNFDFAKLDHAIDIAGVYIETAKALPNEIEKFLVYYNEYALTAGKLEFKGDLAIFEDNL